MMYQIIKERPNIYNLYKNKVLQEGSIDKSYVEQIWDDKYKKLADAYNESRQ